MYTEIKSVALSLEAGLQKMGFVGIVERSSSELGTEIVRILSFSCKKVAPCRFGPENVVLRVSRCAELIRMIFLILKMSGFVIYSP